MRGKFYDSIPLARFEEWMHWTLPALNMNELGVLFEGLKDEPRSSRFKDWVRLARETLEPERWQALDQRVGLSTA